MSTPDQYALIGHPIAHSRSPRIHAAFAQQTGQQLSYRAIDVPPEQLAAQVQAFFAAGGRGMNVTVPHKQAVIALTDRLTERARIAGAVNTISAESDARLLGDNTDGMGLVRDLTVNLGLTLSARRLLLLGAGGAARGVLAPLLQFKPRLLLVANRSAERAQTLAQEFSALGPVRGTGLAALVGERFDLIIHATSAGLRGTLPALPPGLLDARSVCYDMAYGSANSPFMQWAHEGGAAQVHAGLGMLVEQAAESFAIWRGVRPATAPVLAALRRELA